MSYCLSAVLSDPPSLQENKWMRERVALHCKAEKFPVSLADLGP